MKISIITPTFNSATTIERTIQSVLSQNYPDLEYIIIDGGSKDDTLEIVNKYKDKIAKIVSEPDKGIYDAMNKGIALATGEVVGILNSDDYYPDETVISMVMGKLESSAVDACYGDLVYFKKDNIKHVVRLWRPGAFKAFKFSYGWVPPHPTFFVRKKVYDQFGAYRLDLPIAADFELMLRFIIKQKISLAYLPKILVRMQAGGESARSLYNRLDGMRQLVAAWQMNDLPVPALFYFRPVFKLGQFLKK